ncbi:MAG: TrmH family RNA methyltransferase [Candidatus Taylorbacteria bacterium]
MITLILDNIRSVHNVGSIFRTAETLGIKEIYCIGTTPTPLDRFGRKRKDFAKVALGAEDILKWEHVSEAATLIKKLKKSGFEVVALEQSPRAVDYKSVKVTNNSGGAKKVAIILGNEVDGVSLELLKSVDIIAEIPMAGKKESLNVSVAGAVFLFRLLDR